MAVTGDRRRRTLFDEDQGCYRTSSGNREKRFGRGCVQTSAAVDGGRSFPPTPLFSGPSDGERRSRRWSAHQRSGSPSSLHRYHHLQPPSPPFSSQSSERHQIPNQKFKHSPTHIEILTQSHHTESSYPLMSMPNPYLNHQFSRQFETHNQSQTPHTRETYKPQFHRFENTQENQFETTKTHSRFSHLPIRESPTHDNRITHISPIRRRRLPSSLQIFEPPSKSKSTESTTYNSWVLPIPSSHSRSHRISQKVANTCDKEKEECEESFLSCSCSVGILDSELQSAEAEAAMISKGINNPITHSKISNKMAINNQSNKSDGYLEKEMSLAHKNAIVYDSVHFAEPVNDYCVEKNYKTIPKPMPTLPKGRTTLVDMMQFVSDWFDFEEGKNDCCDQLGDGVVDCVNSVHEKVVDCFDMVKNEEENDKNEEDLIKYEVGVYKSEEIVVSKSECDNKIIEANKNDEDGCPLCDCGEIVVDESTEVVAKSGNSVQGQVVDCLDVVKNGGFPGFVKVPSVVSIESVHSVPGIKVTEIEGEDEPLYESLSLVKLVVSSDCGELIGVENGGLSDSEVTVLVKDSANEDDCNAVAVTQGVQFESSVGAKENVFEVVDDTVEEKLVISCVVMVKAIDLGVVIEAHVGFSEFKIKLERRRQWQIAWAFSACCWTIVLVPLWVWDVLRRDFSVGVYHSHKPNMGLRSIVIQLVLVLRVSTELEVEFFSKKGRLM